jgi:hypothetical protein
MVYHRSSPIWKAAMDLAVHLEYAVRRFPRYHKYTLGSKLRQTAQRLCQQAARANALPGASRARALDGLVMGVESMKTQLTLAQEIGHGKTGLTHRAIIASRHPEANATRVPHAKHLTPIRPINANFTLEATSL